MRRSILFVILIAIPVIAIFLFVQALPDVRILESQWPRLKYHALKEGGTRVEVTFLKTKPIGWVSLSSIPKSVQGAVVTSEDWAFFQHQGFDFKQIREAVEDSVEGQGPMRGASTLSQQTVKNIFLSHDRSWVRKVGEAWLTHRLEARFSKKKILEIYLNIVELGDNVVGVGQAARHYFQKPVSGLNPREAAYLAYLLPSPRRYSRGFYQGELSKFGHKQIQRNLDRMRQAAYISSEEHHVFRAERLSFELGSFDPVKEVFEEDLPDTEVEEVSPAFPAAEPSAIDGESSPQQAPSTETLEEEVLLDVDTPDTF